MFSIEELDKFEKIIQATELDIKNGSIPVAEKRLTNLASLIEAGPKKVPTKQEEKPEL